MNEYNTSDWKQEVEKIVGKVVYIIKLNIYHKARMKYYWTPSFHCKLTKQTRGANAQSTITQNVHSSKKKKHRAEHYLWKQIFFLIQEVILTNEQRVKEWLLPLIHVLTVRCIDNSDAAVTVKFGQGQWNQYEQVEFNTGSCQAHRHSLEDLHECPQKTSNTSRLFFWLQSIINWHRITFVHVKNTDK